MKTQKIANRNQLTFKKKKFKFFVCAVHVYCFEQSFICVYKRPLSRFSFIIIVCGFLSKYQYALDHLFSDRANTV